jgi:Concanavalin A-like lectin/glucanases superfamily
MKPAFRNRWQSILPVTQRNGVLARRTISALCAATLLLTSAQAVFAQCDPPPSGTMVAWYPMDEASGGLSGNLATGNTGIWSPTPPTPVPGMVGMALSFNGVNNWVDSANSIATNFGPAGTATCGGGDFSSCTGDFTIDAWVNIPSYPILPETIVDKRVVGPISPIGYSLYINANRIGLQLADGTGTVGYDNYDSPGLRALTLGVWHHIAVAVKRNAAIVWYLDGVAHGFTVPAHTGSLANDAGLRIGANGPGLGGGSLLFTGMIDELEIYNRYLTGPEIQAIYSAGTNGKCKP